MGDCDGCGAGTRNAQSRGENVLEKEQTWGSGAQSVKSSAAAAASHLTHSPFALLLRTRCLRPRFNYIKYRLDSKYWIFFVEQIYYAALDLTFEKTNYLTGKSDGRSHLHRIQSTIGLKYMISPTLVITPLRQGSAE